MLNSSADGEDHTGSRRYTKKDESMGCLQDTRFTLRDSKATSVVHKNGKYWGFNEDDDEIVVDPHPDSPFEEFASDVEERSFVEEQRLSEAVDELREGGLATDSHRMQTANQSCVAGGSDS